MRLSVGFLTLALAFAMPLVASATNVQTGDEITVSGKVEPSNKRSAVTLQILKSGYTPADLYKSDTDASKTLVYQNEIHIPPEESSYSFTADFAGFTSGEYSAYITSEKSQTIETLRYTNVTENSIARTHLSLAKDKDEVELILSNEAAALGLYFELKDSVSASKTAAFMYDFICKNPKITEDAHNVINAYCGSVIIEALNENKTDNIFEYSELFDYSAMTIGKYYNRDFAGEKLQKDVTGRLKETQLTAESFDGKLTEGFILAAANNPDGYGNLKELINAFPTVIGINPLTISDAQIKNASYKNYGTLDELCSALKKELPAQANPSGGSASGGGSGSRVSVSAGTVDIVSPKPIEKDIFSDIEQVPWAKSAIIHMTEKGIINGRTANTFCPQENITREEFLKILVSAFAQKAEAAKLTFSDVKSDDWFYPYIAKGVGAGIANGKSTEIFGVGEKITRQDMAVMAFKALQCSNIELPQDTEITFSDAADISDYAKTAVSTLKKSGIISGMGNNEFQPMAMTTRAQAAFIVYKLFSM